MMDITIYLRDLSKKIEQSLEELVENKKTPYRSLLEAARYSLLGSGKRLRPILAIATASSLGCPEDKSLRAACSLELVHTYSLIHDDLPCMDDDDLRRGKPTLHKAYPESHAVLAGDYLLTRAFEILAADPSLSDGQKVKLIQILARNAGGDGMIGGQIIDIESENKQLSLESLQTMHRLKTGAMIAASLEFGGILANAGAKAMQALRAFGEEIGLAFQIVDDILDVTSTKESIGKTAASDIANFKATYVSILGLERAKAAAQSHYDAALDAIKELPLSAPILEALAKVCVYRSK